MYGVDAVPKEGYVYWTAAGDIYRATVDGDETEKLASSFDDALDVTVKPGSSGDGTMYVTDAGSGTIYSYESGDSATNGVSSTGRAIVQITSPRTVCLRTKKDKTY